MPASDRIAVITGSSSGAMSQRIRVSRHVSDARDHGIRFWERADALDTKAGAGKKDPADAPAKAGWEAMKADKGSVSSGWMGTLRQAILRVLPPDTIAEMNAKDLRPHRAYA